jgi:circadian clock protein KaiC
MPAPGEPPRVSTGNESLDDILGGGLLADRLYLIEGSPGSGKTTLAFQFLLEGVHRGESVLHFTLSESSEEIQAMAASHGWSLDGVTIRELMPSSGSLAPAEQYTVFHPSEVELSETTRTMLDEVKRDQPTRVVVDSLSELRLLSGDPLRYRRQILALKQFFAGQHCTVLVLDDLTTSDRDLQVQSIAHGAIMLQQAQTSFGTLRRRLSVTKLRGSDFRTGYHDYAIRRGGLETYPRLVAAEHRHESRRDRLPSGLPGLDALIGGGLERGTSTLLIGASGTGKSSIAAQFAVQAAARGERAALFIFDESSNTLFSRMAGLGVPLAQYAAEGTISVTQIDPAELSPGEFAHAIRRASGVASTSIIVIDSLNGYLNSMPDEKFLVVQLHELLTYLGQQGIATVLIATQAGIIGPHMTAPIDASYLSDAVILLRYFEADGEVKQAVSAVKMRGGDHERTIREFVMRDGRMWVGEPLRDYRGVLAGLPEKVGTP